MAVLTYRKTVSAVVSGNLVAQYTFAGLGASLEGTSPLTYQVAPLVFVDNDTNRRLRPDNITELGFDVYGDPAGDNPPYDLQIWIIPNAVASDNDFGAIKRAIRNKLFTFPNGKRWNLWGEEGMELIPEPLLNDLVNKSIKEINMDLLEDAEVYRTTLTEDQDYLSLPAGILLIKEVVVFPASTDAKGFTLEPSAGYDGLIEHGRAVEGRPTVYTLGKKTIGATLTRYMQFNKIPDDDYTIEIHYWKLTDTVSSDTDVPEIFNGYHELIETRASYKVATNLGDYQRKQEFLFDYGEQRDRAQRLQNRFNVPMERVRFGII